MPTVLVADHCEDSRRLLVEILSADAGIRVVGQAKNGEEAVRLAQSLRPQLVALDAGLPGLNALDATREIMAVAPTPIVILTDDADAGDATIAAQALRAGALTAVPKPVRRSSPKFAESAQRFVATVKTMSAVLVVRHHRRPQPAPRHETNGAPQSPAAGHVVAIASSTGGPAVLQRILSALPSDFSTPILAVQHMSLGFIDGFAAWLSGVSPIPVKVAEGGERLQPRTVFLAPEDRHLGVAVGQAFLPAGRQECLPHVLLSSEPPIGGFRPSGTFLFQSVARAFGHTAVAVILTGMGQDGVAGLVAVHQAGGQIIAQDEDSSAVFGMPKAAIAAGLPHAILSPEAISVRLAEITRPTAASRP